ncbi:hypothetical protein BX666DRAFT_1877998 [Dichotomocladium elegans]|nr:hypothetical protein BX666DRAFT_1877998 [Dichotomocladium elegans]
MHHWRTTQAYSPTSLDDESGDPLQFPSEASLTQISMMDNGSIGSLSLVDGSPSHRPTTSPTPLEIQQRNFSLADDEQTPMPDRRNPSFNTTKHNQQTLPEEVESSPPLVPADEAGAGSFPDHLSLFEQESRIDSFEILSSAADGLPDIPAASKGRMRLEDPERDAAKERSTTLTLKEQEKNVELKVNIQILMRELKKYKKMILELNSAMELLQNSNQPCPLPHGMSAEEQINYDAALMESARFRDENERLHKMIADLSAENSKLRASALRDEISSLSFKSPSDGLFKSILSERDAYLSRAEHYQKANHELQENLERLQGWNTEVTTQLINKNKELDKMHENLDEVMRSLHDAKQAVRSKSNEIQNLQQELESFKARRKSTAHVSELLATVNDLRLENSDLVAHVARLKRELSDADNEHQNEIEKLLSEIEKHEQDFAAMEAEVVKVMSEAKKAEVREKEKDRRIEELERKLDAVERNGYDDEELDKLEQELQAKDEQIAEYERRMKEIESQDGDLSALEERYVQIEKSLQIKDAQIKDLEEELEAALDRMQDAKARYAEDLQILEQQFQEVEQAMRERDVRIASLEGHLEAQTDAIQREKGLHREEIKDLEDKMNELAELLREKDVMLGNLEEQLEQRTAAAKDMEEAYERDLSDIKEQLGSRLIDLEEEWKNRLVEVEQRMKEAEEQLKKERRLANEKLSEAASTKRALHQKLEASSMKNGLMSNLLDQYQRAETLTKLNQELQRELEERDQALQRETARLRELDAICARALQEKEELKDLLMRRNSIITHLFERLEMSIGEDKGWGREFLLRTKHLSAYVQQHILASMGRLFTEWVGLEGVAAR